ncbi:hypothetical protein J3R83DRAFT_291, partial [Lanmaoa asiatica]
MLTHPFNFGVWISIALAGLAYAHFAAFHPAMYCSNGTDPSANPLNNNDPVQPLFNLTYDGYWFHHSNRVTFNLFKHAFMFITACRAGGNFTTELVANRACTSFNPEAILTDWGDCQHHSDDYHTVGTCITSPNLHTYNQTMAAGTAFTIAYEVRSRFLALLFFDDAHAIPWKRVTTYDLPSGMPACPDAGCLCTIPDGCGIPNMYMFPYKCKVIPDSTPAKTIGIPKPAVWCEDDPSKCVQEPRQII